MLVDRNQLNINILVLILWISGKKEEIFLQILWPWTLSLPYLNKQLTCGPIAKCPFGYLGRSPPPTFLDKVVCIEKI